MAASGELSQVAPVVLGFAEAVQQHSPSIAVLGDMILDVAVEGDPGDLHPETRVPMLLRASVQESIGGAGNIATILSRLGVRVQLFGLVGGDLSGRQLEEAHDRLQYPAHLVVQRNWPTPKKEWIYRRTPQGSELTRRIDFDQPLPAEGRQALLGEFRAKYEKGVEVLVLADHGLGALGPEIAEAAEMVRKEGGKIVVLPRTPLEFYYSADAAVANPHEMGRLLGLAERVEDDRKVEAFAREHELDLFVTRGEKGIYVAPGKSGGKGELVPTRPVDNPQLMGARDMALAIIALGYALGQSPFDSARVANAFANLVVRQRGNGIVYWHDVYQAVGLGQPAAARP